MKAKSELPQGYKEIFSVNLQKEKKTAIIINVIAGVVMLAMGVLMHIKIPITALFNSDDTNLIFLKPCVLLLLLIIYTILHELVHGIAMKISGTKKVKFGFTGLYAYAGSKDYYNKSTYIFIALAPIVLLGIILAVINIIVSYDWFWVVYFIQIANISGAVGDLYVSFKFNKMPKDILVNDSGTEMKVYSKEQLL